MFSMMFGSSKKKDPSDENLNIPPIPGARSDDDFVVVDQHPGGSGGLYPSVHTGFAPALPPVSVATRPAPQPPFHYLQGVPFRLSKELQMSANKDAFEVQIGDVLAFTARKLKLDDFKYDFSVEKSVLRECGGS